MGELLSLSRLEAGVPGSSKTPVSKPSDSVRVEFDDPVEIIIRGQTELIHRALEIVIRNAVQHTPTEGIVQVNTRLERDEHRLHLIVLDEGLGEPRAQLPSPFEPFFRGENRQEKRLRPGVSDCRPSSGSPQQQNQCLQSPERRAVHRDGFAHRSAPTT